MKKLLSIILSCLVIILMLGFFFSPKKTFSEVENRNLAKFPSFTINSFLDGTYVQNLEDYLNDHFVFRENFVKIKNKTDLMLGKTYINDVYIANNAYLIEDYKMPTRTDTLIKVLNRFCENNPDKKIGIMLVPTSVEINRNLLPKYANPHSQMTTLNDIYQNIEMLKIDVFDTLIKHNQEKAMFYHLDHHWTTDAAYYAYLEFCESFKLEAKDLDYFKREIVSDNFKGSIYSKLMLDDLKADEIVRYIPKEKSELIVDYTFANETITSDSLYDDRYLETKNQYASFLKDNNAIVKITNQSLKNEQKILVIKDSYANCFVPFLSEHYNEVHVIDPRFYRFSISEYLDTNEIDEVLFLYNLNTIDSDSGIYNVK